MKLSLKYRFLLVLALCGSMAVFGQSDKQKQLEEKRQALLQEIKQINSLLFKTRKQEKSVLTEVEDLDQRIKATENLIRVTNQQANLLTREINGNLNKIDQLRDELAELKKDYAAMIRKSYKSKSQQSRVMFLLSSESFLQAYKRLQYMKQYANHRKKQGESIQQKTEELRQLNEELLQQKSKKESLIAENRKTKTQLDQEKKNQQQLIASLKKDEGKFATQIRNKQKEADAIDRQIEALIRAAIAKSNEVTGNTRSERTSTFALNAEAKELAANFTSNKGKLPWPITKGGVVIKSYGKQRHPQLPNVTTFNSGVEIATESGAQARAVFNGVVLEIQQLKGANKAVYIQHGDYITVYNNLTDILVKKGDKVTTKQALGTVVSNRTSGKTIVKFLIYKNTSRMNPADWIYQM
ncbi:murein hydrolase activator EnvC family protein [Luteirhabdus pelagi]|uniref:murein hydrolase activator EnvC family protein n=1 Tax=Luteirhabdus pelagi TaxID=2792783 RepID=UPI00193A8363|nr:peptidoglycan DD-metalloendopeptidase family protein [Luteirhabdus pelagi]